MSRAASGSEWLFMAQARVAEATSVYEMRLAQSMLLPLLGFSLSETAQALGQSVPTVSRLRRDFLARQGGDSLPRNQWGGRRHAYWSPEEEQAFLKPFLEEAEKGGILVVPPLHRALEEQLGRTVPPSTVYRMLHRHGWRKVAPDKRHIKGDTEVQETFKKTTPRNRCSGNRPLPGDRSAPAASFSRTRPGSG